MAERVRIRLDRFLALTTLLAMAPTGCYGAKSTGGGAGAAGGGAGGDGGTKGVGGAPINWQCCEVAGGLCTCRDGSDPSLECPLLVSTCSQPNSCCATWHEGGKPVCECQSIDAGCEFASASADD